MNVFDLLKIPQNFFLNFELLLILNYKFNFQIYPIFDALLDLQFTFQNDILPRKLTKKRKSHHFKQK